MDVSFNHAARRSAHAPAFAERLRSKLPRIPLAFLGFGLHRAWLEMAFAGSFVDFPATRYCGHDVFDLTILAVSLACAIAWRAIGTLHDRAWVRRACGASVCLSTVGLFASLYFPQTAPLVAAPCAILGGAGIALLILLWSELYCRLSPVRVAMYFCASIVAGALIIYICRGFFYPWLFAAMLILPLASLSCLKAGLRALPDDEAPQTPCEHFELPLKPIALMALFALAYGLKESSLYTSTFGPHSAFGTLAIALVVFFGVVFQGGRFDFRTIFRFALPLIITTFLILPLLGILGNAAADFCMTGAYTAFSILIIITLAGLGYHQGISALWLFGIERAVRVSFNMLGRFAAESIQGTGLPDGISPDFAVNALVVLLVAALTTAMLSGNDLSSRWGVTLSDRRDDARETRPAGGGPSVALCARVAAEGGLSQREEEVLLLLADGKTAADIERELVISKGTVKTHTRNIYRKLDVHSRDELADYLDMRR